MQLTRKIIHIKKAVFDDRTYVEDGGILHLCKQELIDIAADFHFKSVDFEIAHPGESCRIIYVGDCVQPAYKLEDGATFPGIVDECKGVGTGTTVMLEGIGISEVSLRPLKVASLLDMSGLGKDLSLTLPQMIQVCLVAEPGENVTDNEYFSAINVASKKVAKYIAQCAASHKPDREEIYRLDKVVDETLPKVVYIFQIFSHAALTDTTCYGDGCVATLPIMMHPNEVLDGALLFRDYYQVSNASPSCVYQNHPIILELMKRHGKDINFVGLIVSNTPAQIEDKKRNVMMCTNLAKYHFNADCAIVTKEGGGHPQIDVGMHCDALEEQGIKTVLVLTEMLSNGAQINELVLFSTPNANAMVSNGCMDFVYTYPYMDRVIGMPWLYNQPMTQKYDSHGPFKYHIRVQRDAVNQVGNTEFESVIY